MRTTEQHRLLKRDQGVWNTTLTKYMGRPAAQPVRDHGVEINTLLEGDLWLKMDFRYSYPGGNFEGVGIYGYDPTLAKYVGLWADSTNSHLNVSEGGYDASTDRLTLVADGIDPTNGEPTSVKQVTEYRDDDTKVFSVYRSLGTAQEILLLEVIATRAADGASPLGDGGEASSPDDPVSSGKGPQASDQRSGPQRGAWTLPSPEHELLRRDEGIWDAVIARYGDHGRPLAGTMVGVETCRLLAGGMWLVKETRAESEGRRFQGIGLYGYDPDLGRYVGAWVDSTNPYRVLLEGDYDVSGQQFTFTAVGTDPSTGERAEEQQVVAYQGEDRRCLSLYRPSRSGRAVKLLDVTATRRR